MEFSVIIPLFNKQNFVKRAVESVIAQNFVDFELIIVNDGSTDESLSVVNNIKDNRIKVINQSNSGVSSARNTGIDIAKNDWICFLDADDYWLPNHLDEILYLLKKYPDAKIYTTLAQEKSKKGFNTIPNSLDENFEGYIVNYFSYAKTATIFNSSSVCTNKIALLEVDKFDTNITHGEDLDVWFKLIIKHKGVVKTVPTVVYDLMSENRAMKSFCNLKKHLLSKIILYRSEDINGLNNFIDYFILRNGVQYYFSSSRYEIIPIITSVKERKGIWKYIYNDNFYFLNHCLYKIYKKITTIFFN